ncbi:histidine kinase [Conexibacter sp. CPCC 206217]|uniref:sensor histidine kinase n=1 Tax=Conexibacter sp. CPCC 206217 TaxID=3064574 RepID=UPI0027213451|nr:histidine kinase [Conexibacter sp. CPCC 206217]MDO8214197.1 histidine kinase [Conexibacter sp. CPCC 206217]
MKRLLGSRLEVAFSAGLLVWAVAEASLIPSTWPVGARLAFALAATAPLALRHRFPFAVAAWAAAAFVLDSLVTFLPFQAVTPLQGIAVAVFAVAAYGQPRHRAVLAVAALISLTPLFPLIEREVAVTPHDMIAFLVMQLLALSAGLAVRLRREEAERAAAQASSCGSEQAHRLRIDLAAERRRIAGELHAIVTRDLSEIAQLASAARERLGDEVGGGNAADAARARSLLGSIAGVTTSALEELRRVLQLLRAEEQPHAVSPAHAAFVTPTAPAGSRAGRTRLLAAGDVAAAALASATVALEQLLNDGRAIGWVSGIVLIVLPLLLLRSRAGFATACVLAGGGLLARALLGWMPNGGLSLMAVIVFASYAAATSAGSARRAVAGGVVVAVCSLVAVGSWVAETGAPTDLPLTACVVAIGWIAGWYVRGSSRLARGLRRDQLLLVAAAPQRLRAAVDAERRSVARDLHDVVAHGISLIGLLAAGARVTLPRDPARARQALDDLDDAVAATRVELARLVATLRAGDEPGPSESPLADLDAVVAGARRAGQRVSLVLDRAELDGVPPDVLACACRIAQEALTNARKHAAGAAVEVRVVVEEIALVVEVRNAPLARSRVRGAGARRGIDGMRERARLLGGALRAEPTPDGGFRVWASLPCGDRSALEASAIVALEPEQRHFLVA